MILRKTLLGVLALVCLAAVPARADYRADRPWAGPGLAPCHHYENRARFLPRDGDVAFETLLAEACAGVRATLTDPRAEPRLRYAAARYMGRLQAGRAMVKAINTDRLKASQTRPLAYGPRRDVSRLRGLVSRSGEFLILRDMGVFAAMRDWAESGASFDLAGALPRPTP